MILIFLKSEVRMFKMLGRNSRKILEVLGGEVG